MNKLDYKFWLVVGVVVCGLIYFGFGLTKEIKTGLDKTESYYLGALNLE